jgi:hypothetical protein
MCDGCSYPTPGCEDAPFPLFYDPGGEFDIPAIFSVSAGRTGTSWQVEMAQSYSGGFSASLFLGEGSGPNPARCDEAVTATNSYTDFSSSYGSGGSCTVIPLGVAA